jgi:uncharacterized protein HemY
LQGLPARRNDDAELLYYLGMSYYQLRQFGENKDALDRALNAKLAPKLADDARRALADCCQDAK